MHFVSFEFLLFFACVLALYLRLPHVFQNRFLVAASYLFYGWWDWRFLGLILLSSFVDFGCGLMAAPGESQETSLRRRRTAVAISVGVNLGILGLFKYCGFFVESLKALVGDTLAIPWGLDSLEIILPVGISFYTFQTMSYTIDVYRGHTRPTRRLDELLLYVAFFPQLVAGPIERSHRLLPQIVAPRRVTRWHLTSGAQLALVGFFKKMVVADNLSVYVDSIYGNPDSQVTSLTVALATYAFAFQIYADFSGYSDIARGIARMMGFDLMVNFRAPYLSTSPREFWRRWHVSLSSWLRDYLYIPLGGNRRGRARTWFNLTVTMLLGGLWHGAAYNFVLWGAFHGLLLALFAGLASRASGDEQEAREHDAPPRSGALYWLKVLAWFQLTCVGWLLFRAEDGAQVMRFGSALLGAHAVPDIFASSLVLVAVFAAPLILMDLYQHRTGELEPWRRWSVPAQAVFHVMLFYGIVMWGSPHAADFIYFQF